MAPEQFTPGQSPFACVQGKVPLPTTHLGPREDLTLFSAVGIGFSAQPGSGVGLGWGQDTQKGPSLPLGSFMPSLSGRKGGFAHSFLLGVELTLSLAMVFPTLPVGLFTGNWKRVEMESWDCSLLPLLQPASAWQPCSLRLQERSLQLPRFQMLMVMGDGTSRTRPVKLLCNWASI